MSFRPFDIFDFFSKFSMNFTLQPLRKIHEKSEKIFGKFFKKFFHQKWLKNFLKKYFFNRFQNIKIRAKIKKVYFFLALKRFCVRSSALLNFENRPKNGHFWSFFQRSSPTENSAGANLNLICVEIGNRGRRTRILHLQSPKVSGTHHARKYFFGSIT